MTADTESTQVTDTANVEENKFDEESKPPEEIDFHDLYLQYANKQSLEMRVITASCVHEGFKLTKETDDIRKLQLTTLELL